MKEIILFKLIIIIFGKNASSRNKDETRKTISPVKLSDHACQGARERFQWSSGTLEIMAERAFKSGLKRHNINGTLKKYVDAKTKNFTEKNIVLYNGSMYIFSENHKLVTV